MKSTKHVAMALFIAYTQSVRGNPLAFRPRDSAMELNLNSATSKNPPIKLAYSLRTPDMVDSSLHVDPGSPGRPRSISSWAHICDKLFRELWHKESLFQDILQAERDKFSLWASNIGVFAELQLSLDFRLRDLDDIKSSIVAQLIIISSHLTRLTQVFASQLEGLHDIEGPVSKRLKRGSCDGETELEHVAAADSMKPAVEDVALKHQRITADINVSRLSIGRSVGWLQRLSNLIRNASLSSQDRKAERFQLETIGFTTEMFRIRFRNVVQAEFAELGDNLLERLVESMLIRRRRFEYRQKQEQRLKLEVSWDPLEELESHADPTLSKLNTDRAAALMTQDGSKNPIHQTSGISEESSKASVSVVSTPTVDMVRLRNLQQKLTISSGRSAPLGKQSRMRVLKAPKEGLRGHDFTCQCCWLVLPSHVAKSDEWM